MSNDNMPQDPFKEPGEGLPIGGYNLPYEDVPITQVNLNGYLADQLDIQAAVTDTPLGKLPVIVFNFRSSAPDMPPLPPIIFVAPAQTMTNVVSMIQKSVHAAKQGAKQ